MRDWWTIKPNPRLPRVPVSCTWGTTTKQAAWPFDRVRVHTDEKRANTAEYKDPIFRDELSYFSIKMFCGHCCSNYFFKANDTLVWTLNGVILGF